MTRKLIPLSQSLNYQVFRLSLLLSRELTRALRQFELTPERWQVLATVWEHPEGVSQSRIAEITLKDKPSVSRLVASMIETGWLTRNDDAVDSRAYVIRASAKANAKKAEVIETLYSHFAPVFRELGEGRQKHLQELVGTYIDILTRQDP